ncbi:unnamed protein product [Rhizophagus irregularis]|nr:unnamed protein product [Rhizophagus irregularis]
MLHKKVKKKVFLTDAQKYELCLYANNNKRTRAQYADWVEQKWGHRAILSDAILIEKAKLLASGLGIPENVLQFSSGWLQGFKKRNGICQQKLQGEAASAD